MFRNIVCHVAVMMMLVFVCLKTAEGEVCSQQQDHSIDQSGINCSVERCYKCTISNSSDYSLIPRDSISLKLYFSKGSGLGPSSRLAGLTQLRLLEMSVSNLIQTPTLPGGFFSDCGQLRELTIFHTMSTAVVLNLVSDSFAGLSNLTKLTAVDLEISELPKGIFRDLRRLQFLDMSRNNLTQIARGTFDKQQELITLFLRGNNISSLVNASFDGLNSLRTIDLHGNKLVSLGKELEFLPLANLTELNLGSNRISQIDSYAFTGLKKLKGLYLGENYLVNLTVNVFNDLTDLVDLDLRKNSLQVLPSTIFSNLRSLLDLDLSESRLERIEAHAFDGLRRLMSLNLMGNMIQAIDDGGFEGAVSLEQLYLNDNQIRRLGTAMFPALLRLTKLDLRNNQLETMSPGTMDRLDVRSLSYLDLSLNPWNCSCENYWLALWLQMNNLTAILANQESTICHSPETLRNKTILSAYDSNHTCPNPFQVTEEWKLLESSTSDYGRLSYGAVIGIIVGSVAAAIAIIIIVGLAVCYHLKRCGFWDRKESELMDARHHRAKQKVSTVSREELHSITDFAYYDDGDKRVAITDADDLPGLERGQPERDEGNEVRDINLVMGSSKVGRRFGKVAENEGFVHDNPSLGLYDDDAHR